MISDFDRFPGSEFHKNRNVGTATLPKLLDVGIIHSALFKLWRSVISRVWNPRSDRWKWMWIDVASNWTSEFRNSMTEFFSFISSLSRANYFWLASLRVCSRIFSLDLSFSPSLRAFVSAILDSGCWFFFSFFLVQRRQLISMKTTGIYSEKNVCPRIWINKCLIAKHIVVVVAADIGQQKN